MIDPRAQQVGLFATILVAFGLAIGNAPLLVWGLALGGIVAAAFSLQAPHEVTGRFVLDRRNPRVGDTIRIDAEVTVRRGLGPFLVRVALPDAMELAAGTNLALGWKSAGTCTRRFAFAVRAAARGPAMIGPLECHGLHPLRIRTTDALGVAEAVPVGVEPRIRRTVKMRHVRGRATTRDPAGDAARLGARGSDFEEVRNYQVGDPLRLVNWRATARQSAGGDLRIMVNESAPEGKKSIWLFLDAGAHMEVGSTHENALDHGLAGALGILSHFVARGYRVGATVYHQPRTRVFYPDTGTRQMRRLTESLSTLVAHSGGEGLEVAVERSRAFLLRERPLVLLVTRPEADAEGTRRGIARVRALTGHGVAAPPIFLFAPTPVVHTLAGGHHPVAAATLRLAARGTYRSLRAQGVRVLDWDPARMPLERLLTREMVAR